MKLDDKVTFPMVLDMAPYLSEDVDELASPAETSRPRGERPSHTERGREPSLLAAFDPAPPNHGAQKTAEGIARTLRVAVTAGSAAPGTVTEALSYAGPTFATRKP